MSSNIVVPALGESITEATVAKWMKQQGESIAADEALVELETDKVTLEVFAPSAGVLSEIRVAEGQTVEVGAVLGVIGDGAGTAKATPAAKTAAAPAAAPAKAAAPAPASAKAPAPAAEAGPLSPAVRKLIEENKLDAAADSRQRQGRPADQGRRAEIPGGAPGQGSAAGSGETRTGSRAGDASAASAARRTP